MDPTLKTKKKERKCSDSGCDIIRDVMGLRGSKEFVLY